MPLGKLAAVGILAGLSAAAPGLPEGPSSWDIALAVSARGEYGLESGPLRVDGRYAFTVSWRGIIHTDDEDYLLLHGETKVVDWSAEERAAGLDLVTVLTTGDFPDRPELKVNYVLRMADGLRVDFIVRGFDVPLSVPEDAFYLHFPASAENEELLGGLKYNLSLAFGSNAVVLDEPAGGRESSEKTFRWTWKRRNWVQRQDRTVLQSSAHSAEVRVSVTPRTN
ncbi:MAG: hypothetical protein FJY82_08235 [Candidatus Aminicenantes bacterium]|nr:hypothetical protein [Candidatus Aminicenantes bacterium]